jgi:hypothetical protein
LPTPHTVLIINIGEIDAARVALGPDIHRHDGNLDRSIP